VCQAPRQSADWNLCVGYIEGAADELAAVNLTCPGGVAYLAMVQAFMNWAAVHPESGRCLAATESSTLSARRGLARPSDRCAMYDVCTDKKAG
jgi:hypothetical protein